MKGKFKFQDDYIYKMPAHFGGSPFYPIRAVYGDMLGISVQYETDQDALLQYIPEDFELREPVVSVQYTNCRDVVWMSGGEYRLIQVSAPVKYLGNSDGLSGDYALVVWENKTCPIIGGREEDGVPKVFADIANERRVDNHWFTTASYESCTFLKIDFNQKDEVSSKDIEKLKANKHISLQVGTQVMHAEKNQENWLLDAIIGGSTDKIKLKIMSRQLTISEIARLLDITRPTVYSRLKSGNWKKLEVVELKPAAGLHKKV